MSELVILSSEVGHEKPSKEIFELAVTRAAVAANTCLFCTETLLDTLAAQQVGMRAARLLATAGDLNALPTHLRDAGTVAVKGRDGGPNVELFKYTSRLLSHSIECVTVRDFLRVLVANRLAPSTFPAIALALIA